MLDNGRRLSLDVDIDEVALMQRKDRRDTWETNVGTVFFHTTDRHHLLSDALASKHPSSTADQMTSFRAIIIGETFVELVRQPLLFVSFSMIQTSEFGVHSHTDPMGAEERATRSSRGSPSPSSICTLTRLTEVSFALVTFDKENNSEHE